MVDLTFMANMIVIKVPDRDGYESGNTTCMSARRGVDLVCLLRSRASIIDQTANSPAASASVQSALYSRDELVVHNQTE